MLAQELNQEQSEAVLKFDHNVIEHLGIKLYQNKVINVLAELLANSWDADAKQVAVDVQSGDSGENSGLIAISDFGTGMDYQTIRDRYLIIGKPKRKSPNERSAGNRLSMGRKGIGKLAPFGVARQVDVITAHDQKINWFTLDVEALLRQGPSGGSYPPVFHLREIPLNSDVLKHPSFDQPLHVTEFVSKLLDGGNDPKTGTLILMSKLTTSELPSDSDIERGLASSFTVVLARDDFMVAINGKPIDPATAIPSFELRIPPLGQPYATDEVGGKVVRYWVGFVGAADWSADEAGVGVFVHGKIGQDRPFFFGAKGKEIYQRYLTAL
jgi:hypothetical protein